MTQALLLLLGTLTVPPVTADIWIENQGPYRFLIDTGLQSTVISPDVASALRLRPEYRVIVTTAAGEQTVPAASKIALHLDDRAPVQSEVLWYPLDVQRQVGERIDGVLGQSFLSHFNYLLDIVHGRLEISESGVPHELQEADCLPLIRLDGRPGVISRIGTVGEARLVLDSGASHLILFRVRTGHDRWQRAELKTSAGHQSVPLQRLTDLRLGAHHWRDITAALVSRDHVTEDGLLPVHWFRAVYVDNTRNLVLLQR